MTSDQTLKRPRDAISHDQHLDTYSVAVLCAARELQRRVQMNSCVSLSVFRRWRESHWSTCAAWVFVRVAFPGPCLCRRRELSLWSSPWHGWHSAIMTSAGLQPDTHFSRWNAESSDFQDIQICRHVLYSAEVYSSLSYTSSCFIDWTWQGIRLYFYSKVFPFVYSIRYRFEHRKRAIQ